MPFCANCGAQYDEGTKFCPSCGATTAPQAAEPQQIYQQPQQEYQQPNYQQQGYQQQGYQQPNNQPPVYQQPALDKSMSVLAMIFPVLFFLPLVAGPKDAYNRYYANQSLLLLILGVAVSILSAIFTALHIGFIGWLLSIAQLVLWIIGIVNVCSNTMKPLPVIGGFELIK